MMTTDRGPLKFRPNVIMEKEKRCAEVLKTAAEQRSEKKRRVKDSEISPLLSVVCSKE